MQTCGSVESSLQPCCGWARTATQSHAVKHSSVCCLRPPTSAQLCFSCECSGASVLGPDSMSWGHCCPAVPGWSLISQPNHRPAMQVLPLLPLLFESAVALRHWLSRQVKPAHSAPRQLKLGGSGWTGQHCVPWGMQQGAARDEGSWVSVSVPDHSVPAV